MVEKTFRIVNPLAYKVNILDDFDANVLTAFNNKDNNAFEDMTRDRSTNFNLYICINKGWHAFVMCAPAGTNDPAHDPLSIDDPSINDPFVISDYTFVWILEICYENEELKMYKLRKEFAIFKDVKERIKRSYFIGKYIGTHPICLQFAALRAAPHHYNVLLDDCVEFSKEFCFTMLSYCKNAKHIEPEVKASIQKATASGLKVEYLSRKIRSSGWFGNTFLNAFDLSTIFSGRVGPVWVVLFLLYPLVASCIVTVAVIYYMRN